MDVNSVKKWSLGLVLVVALVGYVTKQRGQSAQAATDRAAAAAETAEPNQAQVLHVITTLNSAEVEAAQLAKSKSKNQRVLEFAELMIKDHTANNQQAMNLAQSLNLKPESNTISRSLQTDANATLSNLKNLSGAEFDKAYMAKQVNMHQTALKTIDENLLPNARNGELKSFLETTRAKVAAHLEQARQIQGSLEGAK